MELNQILKLRNRGMSVFPVSNETKIPLVKWDRLQDELPTLDEVKEWFTPNNRSVGVAMGKVSGTFLLDFDFTKHPESKVWYEANKHRLPRTWSETTKSGGLHLYLKWTPALEEKQTNTTSVLAKGVDTKGYGGYSKMTPSEGYKWIVPPHLAPLANPPEWLVALLPAKGGSFRRVLTGGIRAADWFSEALASLKEGNRNQTLTKLAGSLRNRGYEPRAIFDLLKGRAVEVQFPLGELEIICQSVGRYPVGTPPEAVSVPTEVKEFQVDSEKYLEELAARSQFTKPEFSTGFGILDRITRGFIRQNLFVIGAPTNGGKTQFVLSSVLELIRAKKKVLFFSTEMPQKEIRDRFISLGANVPLMELTSGRLEAASADRVRTFLATFDSSLFLVSPEDQPTLEAINSAVERIKPDILFLDHIHHVKLGENRRTDLDDFIMGLKKLVMKYDIPGVITAQLRRKEPIKPGVPIQYTMHDFKESGGIENEAGVCFLLCPPDKWTEERVQRVVGYIPKNRHGRREVRFSLDFETNMARFVEPL